MKLSIIFPVLNEEKRLENGVRQTVNYLDKFENSIDYELIIADNGSTDNTEKISVKISDELKNIKYIKLKEKGVGLAIREGGKVVSGDIIGYMDIDLSTDISHISDILSIFNKNKNINVVVGSRNLKNSKVYGRSFMREITSKSLAFIINIVLGGKFKDYMCGFKFFSRDVFYELIKISSDYKGWFYCAELLIISDWINLNIVEFPVTWKDDSENSKVNGKFLKIVRDYLKQILYLRKKKQFYLKKNF